MIEPQAGASPQPITVQKSAPQQPARYAIVTGAGSGLGRALAVKLGASGYQVAIVDIDPAGAQATLAQIEQAGGGGLVDVIDVSDASAWLQLRQRLGERWPRLDLLINNAGVAASGEVGQMSLADWKWLLDTNLMGTIWGCHTMIPWLRENPSGAHLVNVASVAGLISPPAMAAYNVSKAAVVSLSETLSAELARNNVGVTVVCPAFFATNLLHAGRFGEPRHAEFVEASMRRSPITAEQVAQATLDAVARRQLHVVLPLRGKMWWWVKRVMPALVARFLGNAYRRDLPDGVG